MFFWLRVMSLASCGVFKAILEKSVSLPLQIPILLSRVARISSLINFKFRSSRLWRLACFDFGWWQKIVWLRITPDPVGKIALTLALVIWLGFVEFSVCAAPLVSAWGRLMRGMPEMQRGLEPGITHQKTTLLPALNNALPLTALLNNKASSLCSNAIASGRDNWGKAASLSSISLLHQAQLPVLGHPSVRTNLIGPLHLLPVINDSPEQGTRPTKSHHWF